MFLLNFYKSTVGKKIIMAVTGLIGIGYVIVHMVGNLQAFIGAEKINGYARFLHGPASELVWIARVVLIVAVILHVLMAYQLTVRARSARPVAYRRRDPQVTTIGARTMRWGGVFLLVFIVFHIMHFTTGTVDPAGAFGLEDGRGGHDVYGNIVGSFRIWWVALLYVVAMIFLGLHLYHGAWSSVRTIGLAPPSRHPMRRQIALLLTFVIWLGFTLVPLGVVAGIIR